MGGKHAGFSDDDNTRNAIADCYSSSAVSIRRRPNRKIQEVNDEVGGRTLEQKITFFLIISFPFFSFSYFFLYFK